ncbi:WD repeat-containing protein 41 [Patella vulgata]|uniref:WD repeat-containing protein 41 n=1 Tax=Patella vulgata TaxID=6465 RepID=UPI0021806342|nr:WD repeat-containing protein 41 [Patella vulgata]
MSVLQRFWTSSSKDKQKSDKQLIPDVEDPADGQPYNPYTEILILQHHKDIVRLILPIDDFRCATAGDDSKVVIWDIQDGCSLHVLSGHDHPITCMILHGEIILTASSDKTIRVWDIYNGQCLHILKEHCSSVKSLVSIPESTLFVSGGEHICLWNENGQLLKTLKRTDTEEDICIMISINHNRIVTAADKQLVVFSVTPADDDEDTDVNSEMSLIKSLPPHREVIHSLIKVSKSCFASGSIDGMIVLWTTHNLLPAKYFNTITNYQGADKLYPYSIQCMFCLQEQYLFAAIGSGFGIFDVSASKDGLICRKISAHFSKILNIGMTRDGSYMLTSSEDGSIRLWGKPPSSDPEINEKLNNSNIPMEKFTRLSSEELKRLNGENCLEPELLGEFIAHSGAVQTFVDYDKEGIVSCGADGLVIVWKNSELQKVKRNRMIAGILSNHDGIV